MSNDKMQAVISKIQKLMALAGNNPSEAEAAAAAEKAQALLAEYNLSEADLKAADKPMSDMCVSADYRTPTPNNWRFGIGRAVAELYFCAYFIYENKSDSSVTHCFAGAQHNVAVARHFFAYLVETIERLAQAGSRGVTAKEKSPYRVTFRTFASITLQNRLDKRKRDAEAGNIQSVNDDGSAGKNLPALLSLYTQEKERVQSFLDDTLGKMKKSKGSRGKQAAFNAKGLVEGRAAGESIGLDTQIGKSDQKRISNV
jgi:hypothetical protein